MADMRNMNKIMKELYLPGDARSTRGMMARGRNVYKGGSPSAKTTDLQKAAKARLKARRR